MGQSVFAGHRVREALRGRGEAGRPFVSSCGWWMDKSYDEIKSLVFTPELKRSWFVLSSGSCPSCGESVPMYDWIIDPLSVRWKVRCPHCDELFPKNDFGAYYESGLDSHGVFSADRADRSLLVAPDGGRFGVDDGTGFVGDDGRRWLFIAAYLVHGQWQQAIVGGLDRLTVSYALTGDAEYARRAAILLYRISEFFPDYDWREQGVMYEQEHYSDGYVGYWASTAHDLRTMALAYDLIREVIADDEPLANYLGADGPAICRSIEDRILRDALDHREKFASNPPNPQNAAIIIKTVLGWPANRTEVFDDIDRVVELCTAVDGLVGEKGVGGYAAIGPRELAILFLIFENAEAGFVERIIAKHPVLYKTYRFHIDTWYRSRYYPGVGDFGAMGEPTTSYPPTLGAKRPTPPFTHGYEWFTLQLARIFEDLDFYRALYLSNHRSVEGLFESDALIEHPEVLRREVREAIDRHGADIPHRTVHYDQWRLALLYSGDGNRERLLSLCYESGANHSNNEALNIGLFAHGLNLLPSFGYPPVNHGGWQSDRFFWYRKPASHNLVVVDGRDHTNLPEGRFLRYPEYGTAIVSPVGTLAQMVFAEAKEYAGVQRYDRLCLLVDVDELSSYVVDVFRVRGGTDHAFFLRSGVAALETSGLTLQPGEPYGHGTFMRNFRTDPAPAVPFAADFLVEDVYGVRDTDEPVHLRYHGLTSVAAATVCESWVDVTRWHGDGAGAREVWIPTLMLRRDGPGSAFAGVLEPYAGSPILRSVRRLEVSAQESRQDAPAHDIQPIGLAVEHSEGTTDYVLVRGNRGSEPLIVMDPARGAAVESAAVCTVVRVRGEEVRVGAWPEDSLVAPRVESMYT